MTTPFLSHPTSACTRRETTPGAIGVREISSFHLGGRVITLRGMPGRRRVSTPNGAVHPVDPNGEIIAGQMYVQCVRLAAPRSCYPMLMWHGGGMCGTNWESTPDGRPGWQMFFLREGFDVLVSDAVERGRSGWAPWPEVYDGVPFFRTGREAWEETFRFGPPGSWHAEVSLRTTHAGLRFPAEHMEAFMSQFVPRWACNDERTQAAYDLLVATQDHRAIVLTHSQGGQFGLRAALRAPGSVAAVVSLEPSGAPDPMAHDARILRGVPHLFVWGDYLAKHPFWVESVPRVRRWHEAMVEGGVDSTWIDLPALGIDGNSHALMSDDNSDTIAALVLDWLDRRGLRSSLPCRLSK